jgi:hypothetical protein
VRNDGSERKKHRISPALDGASKLMQSIEKDKREILHFVQDDRKRGIQDDKKRRTQDDMGIGRGI